MSGAPKPMSRKEKKEAKTLLNKEIPLNPHAIVKWGSQRGYEFLMDKEPNLNGPKWQWFMRKPQEVTPEQFEEALQVPGRRWYVNDKASYQLMLKHKCSMDDSLEAWVSIPVYRSKENPTFWIGRRLTNEASTTPTIICSVGEMYLKSSHHQGRMYASLINSIRRVTGCTNVVHAGNAVEIRDPKPADELLAQVARLPGVANVYTPDEKSRFGTMLYSGPGGIPILRDQPGLCLLSGGIDSPVAAYKMMCRGLHVNGVHFLNATQETAAVMDKNRRIGQTLSKFQGTFNLSFVDIGPLQTQIVALVPNHNRTLVYKWFMLNIAAAMDNSHCLITGDSMGQVASQTPGNISTLYGTTSKAVASPLMGSSKNDIMKVARQIDTYEESIIQASDCCQYMMCKTGANLFIGKPALRELVSRIEMRELTITTETYFDGKLIATETNSHYKPAVSARKNDITIKEAATESNYVYFDAGAGTPVAPQVQQAMVSAPHGNPNSLHHSGRQARMAIEKVRTDFASMLKVRVNDIIFTSGGTESNNIALQGYKVVRDKWSHPSTVGGCGEEKGFVKVVDLVNHETGTVNVDQLKRPEGGRLHVDACQALFKIDWSRVDMSEVDTMAFSAHKINGPEGMGVLYVRDLDAQPLFYGGSQEKGIRPGTENVSAIVGFGAAMRLDRSRSQHQEVEAYITSELKKINLPINRGKETSGFTVHTTIPEGFINHEVVAKLSAVHHVECGTGSACKTSDEENLGVYEHLGITPLPIKRSLRFSWDYTVTMEDAIHVIMALRDVLGIEKVRKQAHTDPNSPVPENAEEPKQE